MQTSVPTQTFCFAVIANALPAFQYVASTVLKLFRSSLSPKEVLGRRWRGWVLKVLAEGQLIALGATRPVRAAAKTHRSAGASKTSRKIT